MNMVGGILGPLSPAPPSSLPPPPCAASRALPLWARVATLTASPTVPTSLITLLPNGQVALRAPTSHKGREIAQVVRLMAPRCSWGPKATAPHAHWLRRQRVQLHPPLGAEHPLLVLAALCPIHYFIFQE